MKSIYIKLFTFSNWKHIKMITKRVLFFMFDQPYSKYESAKDYLGIENKVIRIKFSDILLLVANLLGIIYLIKEIF